MNIEQLRYFREICGYRSITKAAGALYLSPQALSKSVRALETDLGVRLLERSNRGIVPTPAGEILAERSGALLADYDDMVRETREHAQASRKVLSLGVVSCGLMDFPIHVYEPFLRHCPECRLIIREAGDEEMEAALLAGELTVALLGGPVSHPRLEAQYITSFSYSLMVPEYSPLAGRTSVSMSDLQDCSLLLISGRYRARQAMDREMQLHEIRPSSVINLQQRDMIYRMCLQGAGVSIILTHEKNDQTFPGVRFIPIRDFSQTWDLYAVRKKGPHREEENALYEFICS